MSKAKELREKWGDLQDDYHRIDPAEFASVACDTLGITREMVKGVRESAATRRSFYGGRDRHFVNADRADRAADTLTTLLEVARR